MAYGGFNSAPGPKEWAFFPTGATQPATLAATTITMTLTQFTTSAPYAPQCAFWNIGAANLNSVAFVAFGSTTVSVAATIGTPIAAISAMSGGVASDAGMQILSTGKSPQQYLAIGSAGTTTVYVTPGEGSH